jgi:hypothetical protein
MIPTHYPCGTPTTQTLRAELAQHGIAGPAADSIIQLTTHKRHIARCKVVAFSVGMTSHEERHEGKRAQTIAALTMLADQVGVGGHANLTGEGTSRVPALKDIPTKQSQSGGAWDAALTQVLNNLMGMGTLRMRAHWTGDQGDGAPPQGTTELVAAIWVEWPAWLSDAPRQSGILWIHVDGHGSMRSPLGGVGTYHLSTLAQYMCAVSVGVVESRHTISTSREDARHWSSLAMALEGQRPAAGWTEITSAESPGVLGDLEIAPSEPLPRS